MADPTTTGSGIDPTLQTVLDAFPFRFTVEDGVEVAREKSRQRLVPPEALPAMRRRANRRLRQPDRRSNRIYCP